MSLINISIIILTIFTIRLSIKVYEKFLNPCNVFCIVWCLCITASMIGLFDFNVPNQKTQIYIFIVILFFCVFSIISYLNAKKIHIKEEAESNVSIRATWLLLIVLIIFLFPTMLQALGFILENGMKRIRDSYLLGTSGYLGFWRFYIYSYAIRPIFIVLSLLAAYMLAIDDKHKISYLLIALIVTLVHVLISGGRKEIFNLLMFIFIAKLMRGKRNLYFNKTIIKFKRINYKSVLFVGILLVLIIGLVFVTLQRLYFGQSIWETVWQYFIGPMSYLDIIINNPRKFGIEYGNCLYGKALLGFLSVPISTLISFIFGRDYCGADYLLGMYSKKFYSISPKVKLNATETIIYPFLRDFGTVGIIIGPIVLAIMVTTVYIFASVKKNSIFWQCLMIYIYFTLFFSIWRYQLVYSEGAMVVTWLVIFWGMKKRGNKIVFKVNMR